MKPRLLEPPAVPWVVMATVLLLVGGCRFDSPAAARTTSRRSPKAAAPETAVDVADGLSVLLATPIPTGLPLANPEGTGADGYPLQTPDQVVLRSLLVHKRFAELTSWFEQYQGAFEKDPLHEYWPVRAAQAFRSTESFLTPLLDEWVAASPTSFGPYLARGFHHAGLGFAKRGAAWASETSEAQFAAMRAEFAVALQDLRKAATLRPRLMATTEPELGMASALGQDPHPIIERAEQLCPTCFQPRAQYLKILVPKWGGSYAEMEAYSKQSQAVANRRMPYLFAYADIDRAETLEREGNFEGAMAALDRACALGDFQVPYTVRGDLKLRRGDLPGALQDYNRAIALRPLDGSYPYDRRAKTLAKLGRWEAAAHDLLIALRIDSASSTAFNQFLPSLLEAAEARPIEERRRLLDLAAELGPTDARVRNARAKLEPSGNVPARH